jgi:DNA repair exonuclease SbcCD ATPase subunit
VDHSEDGKSRIRNTGAILTGIEKLNENGRKLYYGYFDVLDTSLGKDLQTIIRAGGKVGVSSRSLGSTENGEWQGKPAEIVQEDLNIKAFDFVIGQSTKDAVVTEFTEQMQVVNLVETGPCPGCPNRPNEIQETKGGNIVMDIKTLEELKKTYPDLCLQLEKEAMAKKEKELKEAMKVEWDAEAKKIAEGIEKTIKESKEYKAFTEQKNKHKDLLAKVAGLVADYADEGEGSGNGTEEQLKEAKTKLDTANTEIKSLKEQMEKEKTESANKEKVKKRIEEVTAGKQHEKQLQERLTDCKTVEEVDQRVAKEEAFIKNLLESKGDGKKSEGTGKPLDEDKTDDKTKSQLTEQQKRDRKIAGLE